MVLIGHTFKFRCSNGMDYTTREQCGDHYISPGLTIDEIRHSISCAIPNTKVNAFVIQTPNESQKTFNRKLIYIEITLKSVKSVMTFGFRVLNKTDDRFDRLKDIDKSLEMIGLFMYRSDTLYVLFKDQKAITYCLIDDVSNQWIHN